MFRAEHTHLACVPRSTRIGSDRVNVPRGTYPSFHVSRSTRNASAVVAVRRSLLQCGPRHDADAHSTKGRSAMEKKSRLGRGLEALIGDENTPTATAEVPVDSIENNPYQPRKTFDDDELSSLS